mmetsp:Transcript_20551/g.41141  ORF Transcript_20551/g.41141 Transcript_20551/m.41141 type:complete len:405 (+) Transcript_20551:306-1520(+)
MVKCIKDNPDQEGGLLLIGTCKQTINNTAAWDPETNEFEDEDRNFFFPYRINEEVADNDSGFLKVRSVEENKSITCTSFAVRAPLEIDSVFDEFPFQIIKASITIELGTISDKENKKRLRPNLHLNLQHKSSNVAIQPPDEENTTKNIDDKMDQTYDYNFVTPYPEVRYVMKVDKDDYSKYVISFYLVDSGFNKLIAIVFPMLLIFVMTLFNVSLNEKTDAQDFLANSATFALAVVFLLENVVTKSRKDKFLTKNSWYILMVFISLMLCSVPAGEPSIFKMTHNPLWGQVGVIIFGCSFLIPIYNMIKFNRKNRDIKNNCPPMEAFIDENVKMFKPLRDDFNKLFSPVSDLVKSTEQEQKDIGYVMKRIGPLRKKKLHIEYTSSLDKKNVSAPVSSLHQSLLSA